MMLSERQRAFLHEHRVARLATADASGQPHVLPVCFVLDGDALYVGIDRKPKRGPPARLKRLRNIAVNARVALTVDRWDEDWSRLAWVMVQGAAEVLAAGPEHDRAQDLLRARYPQYRDMDLAPLPVIAIRIERALGWRAQAPEEAQ